MVDSGASVSVMKSSTARPICNRIKPLALTLKMADGDRWKNRLDYRVGHTERPNENNSDARTFTQSDSWYRLNK